MGGRGGVDEVGGDAAGATPWPTEFSQLRSQT